MMPNKLRLFIFTMILALAPACANAQYQFTFLWGKEIEVKKYSYPSITMQKNYVVISHTNKNNQSFLHVLNEKGLIWKKHYQEKLLGHEFSSDGRFILAYVLSKKSSGVLLYDISGKLVWKDSNFSFYLFSEDGNYLTTNHWSDEYFFKSFTVFDFKGKVVWTKQFPYYVYNGIAFNNAKHIVISIRGDDRTFLFDSEKGLLWEKKTGSGTYMISEDRSLILASFPGGGSKDQLLFYLLDLKGNILIEGERSKHLLGKDPLSIPTGFYQNKLLIESISNDYLVDAKGNVQPLNIRNDFIKKFELKNTDKKYIELSPNLKFLIYRPDDGNLIKYYRIAN